MIRERGQATVELALALPVLLFVLAALVEVGLIVADQVRLWHSAREAVRAAVVDDSPDVVSEAARGAGLSPLAIAIDPEPAYRRQGEPLTVSLSYDRQGVMPFVSYLFSGVELRAEATMRTEEP
jgi:TadE-like protein